MKRFFTLMFFICVILVAVLFSAGENNQSNLISTTGNVIRNGDTESDTIAFACNVDWGSEILPSMFKIFNENSIKVTFFVTGKWAEKNPQLLREMYLRGHEVGNHGYGHKLCSQNDTETVIQEIRKTEAVVRNLTGMDTVLFAPPSGDYNEETINICDDLGYKLILWSIDTIDWKPDSTADKIKSRVIEKPLKGAIVLMHPKEETAKALPEIINYIHSQGVEIVPVGKLIEQQ